MVYQLTYQVLESTSYNATKNPVFTSEAGSAQNFPQFSGHIEKVMQHSTEGGMFMPTKKAYDALEDGVFMNRAEDFHLVTASSQI